MRATEPTTTKSYLKHFFRSDRGKTAGAGENHNQHERKNMITPILAELTGNLHVGMAAIGAAIGVGMIGMKASEAVGRNPGAATQILVQAILSTAFAEGIVFFAIFLVH